MKRTNNALILSVSVYLIVFYGIWAVWELWGRAFISNTFENEYVSQFIKSGIIKNLVWTLPAVLLINHFKDHVYVDLKEMFKLKPGLWRYLPIFLLFTVYLLGIAFLQRGRISVSETFRLSDLIILIFVGLTEETVFRGWLLNITVGAKKRWIPMMINSLLFLLIHFPIWIYEGRFVENFQNWSFAGIIILSFIFSWTFIKSKNILIPILLHMYWDLLMFLFY